MPSDLQRLALRTLLRIDYNRAVLKARLGNLAYAAWLARRPASAPMPGAGLDVYPVVPLVQVIQNLPDGRFKRHALGSLAASLSLSRLLGHSGPVPAGVHEQALEGFFDHTTFQAILNASPNEAYVLGAFASTAASCQVTIIDEPFSFDQFDVTTAGIEFTCSKPVEELPVNFDPRLWDVRASEVFAVADRVHRGPADPTEKPTRIESLQQEAERGGEGWDGLLYEDAIAADPIASPDDAPSELLEFKNVLSIQFAPTITGPPTSRRIDLDYSLHEALTLQLFDTETVVGGLDRDSGVIRVQAEGGGSRGFLSKSLRIARPENLRELLNWDLALVLPFWLYNMTVLGICEP